MEQTTPSYDVIVVGARCAGAATALLLARSGLCVLMVDRSPPVTDTLSTHALVRTGVFLLDRFGVMDDITSAGTPPVTRSEMVYDTHRAVVEVKPGHGVSALYAPRRYLLDRVLAEAAIAAGVDVAFDVTVTDVERDRTGRVIGIRGRRASAAFRARATLTVGADGLRSTVAKAVGARVRRRWQHAGGLWFTYVTGVPNRGYRLTFRPGAVAGLTPTNDGATCLFVGGPASEFTVPERHQRWPALLARYRATAPDETDSLQDAECVSAVRGWPGHPGQQRQACGTGWALVGDAGYFKDPLGTHGISQALRDAQLLSDAIIDADCEWPSLTTHLSQYEHTRDALSSEMSTAIDELASYSWQGVTAERLMRTLSKEMTREVEVLAAGTGAGSMLSRTA
jgi:flavin-dependent dehydrogenase